MMYSTWSIFGLLIYAATFGAFGGTNSLIINSTNFISTNAHEYAQTIQVKNDIGEYEKNDMKVTLVPDIQSNKIREQDVQAAKEVIRKRLDSVGLPYATVNVGENSTLIVELPKSREEGIASITKSAKIEFKDSDGKVILNGADFVDAQSDYQKISGMSGSQWIVSIKFSEEAGEKFADATERISKIQNISKRYIGIYLDDKLLSAPSVDVRIGGTAAIIEGPDFTAESTKNLAALIRSGALPFDLKVLSVEK